MRFRAITDACDTWQLPCSIGDQAGYRCPRPRPNLPLATAWHSDEFLDPATDGAVLTILHLNGYKISDPTVLACITREDLEQLLHGYGWTPYFVEVHEPALMHEAMTATLDTAVEQIRNIQRNARVNGDLTRPRCPMIALHSPKGWTVPEVVDGKQVEGASICVRCQSTVNGHACLRVSGAALRCCRGKSQQQQRRGDQLRFGRDRVLRRTDDGTALTELPRRSVYFVRERGAKVDPRFHVTRNCVAFGSDVYQSVIDVVW